MSSINKSMDRDDLLAPDASSLINELNSLIRAIYERGITPKTICVTRGLFIGKSTGFCVTCVLD
jgi:hypothetical protein